MKYSKKWLQEYIEETLPADEYIEKDLNAKAFEVEGVEHVEDDSIFDIKVLPNRAHDALGHIGMARELCACLDFTFKNILEKEIAEIKNKVENKIINITDTKVSVEVVDEKACGRFMTVRIDGVKVGTTPDFIKTALNNIGQKSINNIVDITNYVQFVLNKPMHAYDANNIEGGIMVRYAEVGEKLVTLDDKELILDEKTLVIADHKKVLGLAGIKGGKYSGVNADTTSIIIESANFEPVLIRKTSQKYNLKTDASKRFENGISNQLIEDGLYYTLKLILENCTSDTGVSVSEVTDTNHREIKTFKLGVSTKEINDVLGSNYDDVLVEETLDRLNFKFEKVTPIKKIKELIPEVLDKPYKRNASSFYDAPNFFNCSSLINYLYKESVSSTPNMSIDMFVYAKKINKEELRFGDLIFTNTLIQKPKNEIIFAKVSGRMIEDVPVRTESVEFMRGTKVAHGIDHVGMYLGEGKVLHASGSHGQVLVETLDDSETFKNDCWYGRYNENLEEKRYIVYVPHERLDLKIKENMIEEVGRIIGYDKLVPILPDLTHRKVRNFLNRKSSYQNAIRNILFKNNFSEVMNYSFVEKGEVSLLKAASNKNKLRTNISESMQESMNKNLLNMPLLNIDLVKVFEFGSVFTKDGEYNSLCVSIDDGKKKSNFTENLDMIMSEIKRELKIEKLEYEVKNAKPLIIEINFDEVLNSVKVETYEDVYVSDEYQNKNIKFESYSSMPFIVRDIAFWVEEGSELLANKNENKEDSILNIIKENSGDKCIKVVKFDEFKKEIDGVVKISLGYRLIYQSFEKTLTDEEVNVQSDKVYEKLKELGLEIR